MNIILHIYRWQCETSVYYQSNEEYLDCIIGCLCGKQIYHYHNQDVRSRNPPIGDGEHIQMPINVIEEFIGHRTYRCSAEYIKSISSLLNNHTPLEELMIDIVDFLNKEGVLE